MTTIANVPPIRKKDWYSKLALEPVLADAIRLGAHRARMSISVFVEQCLRAYRPDFVELMRMAKKANPAETLRNLKETNKRHRINETPIKTVEISQNVEEETPIELHVPDPAHGHDGHVATVATESSNTPDLKEFYLATVDSFQGYSAPDAHLTPADIDALREVYKTATEIDEIEAEELLERWIRAYLVEITAEGKKPRPRELLMRLPRYVTR